MIARRWLVSLFALAVLAGCSRKDEAGGMAMSAAPAADMAEVQAPPPAGAAGMAAPAALQRRYLAVHHTLEVQAEAERVEALWRQIQARSVEMGGEVVSAELSRGDDRQPTASLSLRLPPAQVPALFALLAQGGELVNTRTDSEDKTAEVIDVEARQKNLVDARDRLRQLLAERTGKLADVLEVQKSLTETQSQLDSMNGQRKALAEQTDKIRLDLTIHTPRSVIERSALAPLKDAWHRLGYVASESLAGLLTLLAALLPWTLLGVPLWLLVRRAWRKRRAARAT
ncbi:DUF4349 domain-containing protein [Chitinimonas arctica]|uniref:DUF4349 domain-containing protein n=1 Tax=Chitinimonas arctica TaxID=2594795 RepID=A0A516SFK5_9NEIS|nr:DUF4349 domain-containing protein [Chitinimonas arctica]QDQ26922.1 DUF4349 domain-containing protein [Chitinimonas arctica]